MSPPVISTNMFVTVVKMLSTLCSVCPVMAVELLTLSKTINVCELIVRYLYFYFDHEHVTIMYNSTYECTLYMYMYLLYMYVFFVHVHVCIKANFTLSVWVYSIV